MRIHSIFTTQTLQVWADDHTWIYKLLLAFVALIWGGGFLASKNVTDVMPADVVVAWRFSIAAVVMCLILHKRIASHWDSAHIRRGIALGAVCFLAFWIQTLGLAGTTPGKNAFLSAIYCVIVPFLYWALYRKRPTRYNLLAALLAIAGVGFISLGGDGGFSLAQGDVITIASTFFFALQIVLLARYSQDVDLLVVSALQLLVAAILAWVVTLFSEPMDVLFLFTTKSLMSLLYAAIPCTVVAFGLQSIAQQKVDPTTSSLLLSGESVYGVMFSVALGYELITAGLFVGVTLVFCAVLLNEGGAKLLGSHLPISQALKGTLASESYYGTNRAVKHVRAIRGRVSRGYSRAKNVRNM